MNENEEREEGRDGEREGGSERLSGACARARPLVPSFLPSACVVAKARAEEDDDDDAMHKSERERIWKVGNVFGIK